MAKTRVWQAGAESAGTSSANYEFTSITAGISVSTTTYYSGAHSFRIDNGASIYTAYAYRAVPATRQIRLGLWWKAQRAANGSVDVLGWFSSGPTELGELLINTAGSLSLEILGNTQDTETGIITGGTWYHIGVDVKIDASAGWAKVYLNGVEILSFSGNTGDADLVGVRYGDWVSNNTVNYADDVFLDDLYIDDTTGEAAPGPCPVLRFYYLTPNGNGEYSQLAGSDADSTDNYLLVDDVPLDSDTTYVEGDTTDEQDSYALTTFTVPAGYEVKALIPVAYARKVDSETDTEIAFLVRSGTTDVQISPDQDLATAYTYMYDRLTTKPGGGDWDQTSIDDVQVGVVAEGTY